MLSFNEIESTMREAEREERTLTERVQSGWELELHMSDTEEGSSRFYFSLRKKKSTSFNVESGEMGTKRLIDARGKRQHFYITFLFLGKPASSV